MTAAIIALAVLVIAAVLVQVLIPRIGERQIERRLVRNGGDAFVALAAMPSIRLLRREGDRIVVRGRRLAIGMSRDGGGLSVLDGFESVDIALGELATGPFDVTAFELTREGHGPYRMRSAATTSGTALAGYGGETLGGLAPLLGMLARQAPLGSRNFRVEVEVELVSENGVLSIASGDGTIAGYPAGPIAKLIATAVARGLEIGY
jgi:hypothetical protein